MNFKAVGLSAAALMCVSGAAFGQSVGADATLADIQSVSTYGPVGGTYAYAIGSHTCNIGNQNYAWANNGTPSLSMNLYRMHNGRLVQIGQSFGKTACCAAAGTSSFCGPSCNGQGGSVLGAGCLDVYSSGWNASQSRLIPRSRVNGFTGAFQSIPAGSGDAIWRRLQVPSAEMHPTTYAGAMYFAEGHYVCTEDANNGNWANNCTYKRVNISSTYQMSLPTTGGVLGSLVPAIRAWRDHGLGVNQVDNRVQVAQVDVPAEGRFWYANKVTDLGNGQYRYDYAVFNFNSDRAGASFSVPVPAGVTISNIGMNKPLNHSGEIYNNDAWVTTASGGAVTWSTPQTFLQNANSSAIRYGTMYNFWFDADAAPAETNVNATLGMFKLAAVNTLPMVVRGPSAPPCVTDYNQDGGGDTSDVLLLADDIASGVITPPGGNPDFNNDGGADTSDVIDLADAIAAGSCP